MRKVLHDGDAGIVVLDGALHLNQNPGNLSGFSTEWEPGGLSMGSLKGTLLGLTMGGTCGTTEHCSKREKERPASSWEKRRRPPSIRFHLGSNKLCGLQPSIKNEPNQLYI